MLRPFPRPFAISLCPCRSCSLGGLFVAFACGLLALIQCKLHWRLLSTACWHPSSSTGCATLAHSGLPSSATCLHSTARVLRLFASWQAGNVECKNDTDTCLALPETADVCASVRSSAQVWIHMQKGFWRLMQRCNKRCSNLSKAEYSFEVPGMSGDHRTS